MLREGARVRIDGLRSATQHNGRTGVVRHVPAEDGARLGVELDGAPSGTRLLSVRRENLEEVV